MLTEGILDPGYFNEATQTHPLTIAGVRDVPVEITGGLRIDRHDLRSTHEEADILIAQHAISLSLTGKSGASSVKLCSSPPTTEAFTENVHECHLQVAIWKAAHVESPPEMDSTKYGWELDHLGNLVPRTVPFGTLSAPPDILQLIHYNGKASGCRTAAYSCTKIGCTIFCLCEGAEACKNSLTRSQTEDESKKTI